MPLQRQDGLSNGHAKSGRVRVFSIRLVVATIHEKIPRTIALEMVKQAIWRWYNFVPSPKTPSKTIQEQKDGIALNRFFQLRVDLFLVP